MALRDTHDRHRMIDRIVRPRRPAPDAPAHHHRHYDVHRAVTWLHELLDAPLEAQHAEFAASLEGEPLPAERLHDLATELLELLKQHGGYFSPRDYASLYHHLSQGLMPQEDAHAD
jgi:hypothetical protein